MDKNGDIYVGMKAYEPPGLVSVKKVVDGWEIAWRFATRYMDHGSCTTQRDKVTSNRRT